MIKRNIYFLILSFLLLITFNQSSFSQFDKDFNISFGVVTTSILGDNRAKLPMVATDDSENAYTGGSFDYSQPGFSLKANIRDDENKIRYGIGVDYLLFSGRERINITGGRIVHYLMHDVNILSFGADFNYVLLELDFANAKIYTGIEAKMYYLHNISAQVKEDWLEIDEMDNLITHTPKPNAFRFGGSVKAGIEGRLRKKLYVNTGLAVGLINLLGRDDERGELLTPLRLFEDKESYVPTLQVFISLQYYL